MNVRKVITIAVPLAIGGGLLAFLWILSGPKSTGDTGTPATVDATAPQDATHERAMLEEQLKQNPDHAPIFLRLSEIAREQGKQTEAVDYLRQALQADPANADARLELGRALYDAGDIEGALQETKKLVEDHPDHVDGLYNLGAIYANQDQMELARQYWSQAVKVDAASESGVKAQNGLQQIGPASVSLPVSLLPRQ